MTQTTLRRESNEPYYDLYDDWSLIVASFQTQYGIRLSRDLSEMSWREFSYYINGLSADTPLGRIVNVRAENDPAALKEFTPEMRRIRNEYRKKIASRKESKDVNAAIESMKQTFLKMAK